MANSWGTSWGTSWGNSWGTSSSSQDLFPTLFTNSNSFYAPTITQTNIPLVPTFIGSGSGTTSASVGGTPADNATWIAVATGYDAAADVITSEIGVTDTSGQVDADTGSTAWQVIGFYPYNTGANRRQGTKIFMKRFATSPGAITVNSTSTGHNDCTLAVASVVSSYGLVLPTNINSSTNSAGDPSMTITTPAATSLVMGFAAAQGNNSFGAVSGYTEISDANWSGSDNRRGVIVYDAASAAATYNPVSSNTWVTGVLMEFVEQTGALVLFPSLFTNTNTFYAPTITTGSVTIDPSLFTNTNTFYGPTVTQPSGGQDLFPSLFTNTQTFFGPTILVGSVDILPSLFTNTQTFFGPTVTAGTINLTPSLFTNTNSFFGPTVTQGTVTLLPDLFTNTNTFFSPSISAGGNDLFPSLFTNTQTFFGPTVTRGQVDIQPSLFTNTNSFFGPTLTTGVTTILPPLFTNTQSFWSPNVYDTAVGPGGSDLPWNRKLDAIIFVKKSWNV